MVLYRLPKVFRSFYLLSLFFLLVWVSFLDENNVFNYISINQKIEYLQNQKKYYQEKIKNIKEEEYIILENIESIERYARENFLMKKKNEDMYVIVCE
ncbi:MAG: septum formation initiator family protein [Chitinophagaceae bacterium]|nr:septum formation initiator family protein [Chitinophagaceae bacterium]